MDVKKMFEQQKAQKEAELLNARNSLMREYGNRLITKQDAEDEGFSLQSMAAFYVGKGFAENAISYKEFSDRLDIAMPYAEPAAKAIAFALKGKVILPTRDFTAPSIETAEGVVSLTEGINMVKDAKFASTDENEIAEFTEALRIAEEWLDKTIPSLSRYKSTGIAYDVTGCNTPEDYEKAATRAAIASSTGEVSEMKRKYPGEALRAAQQAFAMKDYVNAILHPTKEQEESKKVLEKFSDEAYGMYVIGCALDRMAKAYYKSEFVDKQIACNEKGLPLSPSPRAIKELYDSIDWGWEFKLNYIIAPYEGGFMSYDELIKLVNPPITEDDALRNNGRIDSLDRALATIIAKRMSKSVQTPASWNPFVAKKDGEGRTVKTHSIEVYTKDGKKLTLDTSSIYASVQLKAWDGQMSEDDITRFSEYSSNGIYTCQLKKALKPDNEFYGDEDSREFKILVTEARKLFESPVARDNLAKTEGDIIYVAQDYYKGSLHLGVAPKWIGDNPLNNPTFIGENLWGKALMKVRAEILGERGSVPQEKELVVGTPTTSVKVAAIK